MNLKDKNVVVTGAAGFIGSHLAERLVKSGANVTAFVRYTSDKDIGFINEFDKKTNDATWLRRIFDNKKPEVILIGLRSCEEEELEFMQKNKIKYFIPNNMQDIKKKIQDFTKNSKIYISIDIDAFDPSFAPGVDQPEPNGINFKQFSDIIDSINGKIVGIDVNCLKPLKDNEITEFLASRCLFEVIGKISKQAGVA